MDMSETNMKQVSAYSDAEDLIAENADQHAKGAHRGESNKFANECVACWNDTTTLR